FDGSLRVLFVIEGENWRSIRQMGTKTQTQGVKNESKKHVLCGHIRCVSPSCYRRRIVYRIGMLNPTTNDGRIMLKHDCQE
uniref:Uncharacterized protein n=1 Tax=Parascaris univalens TaxID=6257 RepID=A0A914ZUG0_PARUN